MIWRSHPAQNKQFNLMMFFVISGILCIERRLTSKTFGAEIHGFTGPEETGERINVIDLLRHPSLLQLFPQRVLITNLKFNVFFPFENIIMA